MERDPTLWYAIGVAGIVGACISLLVLSKLASVAWAKAAPVARRLLIHPQTISSAAFHSYTTRWEAVLIVLYLAANASFLIWGPGTLATRAARMSLINLWPLSVGCRAQSTLLSPVGLRDLGKLHRWVGRVAIAEGLLHAGLMVDEQRSSERSFIAGCIVRLLSKHRDRD